MILRVLVRAEYRQIQGLHPLCSRSGGFLHLPSSYLPPKTHTLLSVPDESRAEPGQTNPLTAVWILYFQNGPQNKEIPQRHEQKWNFRHLQWPQRVLTPHGHLVLSRFWHSCCCLSLFPAVVYPCLYVLGSWDRGQKADSMSDSKDYLQNLTKRERATYTPWHKWLV